MGRKASIGSHQYDGERKTLLVRCLSQNGGWVTVLDCGILRHLTQSLLPQRRRPLRWMPGLSPNQPNWKNQGPLNDGREPRPPTTAPLETLRRQPRRAPPRPSQQKHPPAGRARARSIGRQHPRHGHITGLMNVRPFHAGPKARQQRKGRSTNPAGSSVPEPHQAESKGYDSQVGGSKSIPTVYRDRIELPKEAAEDIVAELKSMPQGMPNTPNRSG